MSKLIAHCGARKVDETLLRAVAIPAATETWCPVGHHELYDQLMEIADEQGVKIVKSQFALSEDNNRMFGVLDVGNLDNSDGSVSFAIGIRNSIDKTLPAGICFGARVFVCDNLAFSGEIVIGRRHTKNIWNDLPGTMRTEFSKFAMFRESHYRLFDALKGVELKQDEIWGLVGKAYQNGAITKAKIADVVEMLSDESHIAKHGTAALGGPNTAWSVYNAGTEIMKTRQARNMIEGSTESIAWHQTFANRFGVLSRQVTSVVVPQVAPQVEASQVVEQTVEQEPAIEDVELPIMDLEKLMEPPTEPPLGWESVETSAGELPLPIPTQVVEPPNLDVEQSL